MSPRSGYTLLEMVVVLALLAMATALVAPAGYRMIQAWRDSSEGEAMVRELNALAWRARTEGNALHVPAGVELPTGSPDAATPPDALLRAPHLDFPEGWSLTFDTPLEVGANGVCQDADATLRTTRQVIRLRIDAPYCRARRLPADAP